jgi:RNA ligase (TIGR02306 family)
MRQLVTLRKVAELRPIPNADAIECAIVDGWPVVVKKGEFQVGDTGVYFEIDSFLPASDERFAFLMNKGKITYEGHEGVRLRTIKLRGVVSQGLLLPVTHFREDIDAVLAGIHVDTLEEALGIVKYEPPIHASLAGEVEGPMPPFIRKTDQEPSHHLNGSYRHRIRSHGQVGWHQHDRLLYTGKVGSRRT